MQTYVFSLEYTKKRRRKRWLPSLCKLSLDSNIGVFYASKGRTDDAIEIFKRAAEHNPKEHVAFHNAATFLLKAGEVEESIEYGLKALELSPKNEETMATLALAYKMQGDEERFAKSEVFINAWLSGESFESVNKYLETVRTVTAADLQRVAKDIFDREDMIEIVVGE